MSTPEFGSKIGVAGACQRLGARIRETFARGVEVGATVARRTSSTTAEPLDIKDRATAAIPSGTECLIQFATTLASRQTRLFHA